MVREAIALDLSGLRAIVFVITNIKRYILIVCQVEWD